MQLLQNPTVAPSIQSKREKISHEWQRSIQIAKPTPGGLTKSRRVREEPSHQVTQAGEQYPALRCNSVIRVQPFSNTHVIQYFLKHPSHLQTLLGCGREQRDGRGAGTAGRVLPGFVIKRHATLHLKYVAPASFVCSPPKTVRFTRYGSLVCVALGYWHALRTGWRRDWASGWVQGRRTVSPLSQQPCHHTSAF